MLKWLLTLLIVMVIVAVATPWLRRAGIWRLPGDFRMPVRGRVYYVPFATTVLLSLAVWLLSRFI
jgi:hypothetical protein